MIQLTPIKKLMRPKEIEGGDEQPRNMGKNIKWPTMIIGIPMNADQIKKVKQQAIQELDQFYTTHNKNDRCLKGGRKHRQRKKPPNRINIR